MSKINNIYAREIIDSRGNPTIEVYVYTDKAVGKASVPSGASTGTKEALELRDNDNNRYLGKGVLKAVNNVNTEIKNKLLGIEVTNQELIDDLLIKLDGTKNKSRLGANAILGVSLACIKASAIENNMELYEYVSKKYNTNYYMPYPIMNIINGNMHADNNLDFQEFQIIPLQKTIKERIRTSSEIYNNLKILLKNDNKGTNIGDEGGFAPNLSSNIEALDYLLKAIKISNYKPYDDVMIGIDAAASYLYDKNKELYKVDNNYINSEELLNYYKNIVNNYPILCIEDPFDENDKDSFKIINKELGNKIMIVGDDLYVTNKELLQEGINNNLTNSILIKFNQIGTVTETLDTISLAKIYNFNIIISHRSGETDDTFISDFCVGLGIRFIKAGPLCRLERVIKYNKLAKIEEELNNK